MKTGESGMPTRPCGAPSSIPSLPQKPKLLLSRLPLISSCMGASSVLDLLLRPVHDAADKPVRHEFFAVALPPLYTPQRKSILRGITFHQAILFTTRNLLLAIPGGQAP